MENILRIDQIEKYYGNKSSLTKAIDNISFEVGKQEFVAIMGASGSGKTTLLNCISTIDKVNLNDNILVGEEYYGVNCGFLGFISSDIKEVFPNATDNGDGSWYIDEFDKYGNGPIDKYLKLQFDTNKESIMDAKMKKIKSSKLPWGVKNFGYGLSNHQFSFSYDGLYIIEPNNYGEFGKQYQNERNNFVNKINDATKGHVGINTGCGGFGNYEPQILNEALCTKYNLNCSSTFPISVLKAASCAFVIIPLSPIRAPIPTPAKISKIIIVTTRAINVIPFL